MSQSHGKIDTQFTDLPDEILQLIIQLLDKNDLLSINLVCKSLSNQAADVLWMNPQRYQDIQRNYLRVFIDTNYSPERLSLPARWIDYLINIALTCEDNIELQMLAWTAIAQATTSQEQRRLALTNLFFIGQQEPELRIILLNKIARRLLIEIDQDQLPQIVLNLPTRHFDQHAAIATIHACGLTAPYLAQEQLFNLLSPLFAHMCVRDAANLRTTAMHTFLIVWPHLNADQRGPFELILEGLFRQSLEDRNSATTRGVAYTYGAIFPHLPAEQQPVILTRLKEFLLGQDHIIRLGALQSLTMIMTQHAMTLPPELEEILLNHLLKFLNDNERPHTQEIAMHALITIFPKFDAPTKDKIQQELIKLLDSEHPITQCIAARILGKINPELLREHITDDIIENMLVGLTNINPAVEVIAINQLIAILPLLPFNETILSDLFASTTDTDTNNEVIAAAINACAVLWPHLTPEQKQQIVTLLSHTDPTIQAAVLNVCFTHWSSLTRELQSQVQSTALENFLSPDRELVTAAIKILQISGVNISEIMVRQQESPATRLLNRIYSADLAAAAAPASLQSRHSQFQPAATAAPAQEKDNPDGMAPSKKSL